MRHFISFQKKQALYLEPGEASNDALAHELNHELMAVGYVLTREAFELLASQSSEQLAIVHHDLTTGLAGVVGGGGHEPIYRNFPQSVMALSQREFVINALIHYWTGGSWRPEDAEAIHRELAVEPVACKPVAVLTRRGFQRIFTDLLYSEVSLSDFDKRCVDWYLDHYTDEGGELEFGRIRFKEIAAWVGQRLLANANANNTGAPLPIRSATTLLRILGGPLGRRRGPQSQHPVSQPEHPRARGPARDPRPVHRPRRQLQGPS